MAGIELLFMAVLCLVIVDAAPAVGAALAPKLEISRAARTNHSMGAPEGFQSRTLTDRL